MPFGRSYLRHKNPPVFFLDRGLGVNYVARAIRHAGFVAIPMVEAYPHGADQFIGDDEWIQRASDEGWIALTKVVAITRAHSEALAASTLRVFALNNANLTGPEMAERYLANLNRMIQRAFKPGPYVFVVTATGLEHRWPVLP